MGCCQSAGAGGPANVETRRRRLSVGELDASDADNPETEEDRGLMTQLGETSLEKLLQEVVGGDRKMSVGSQTDLAKTSFANKTMEKFGENMEPAKMSLGYTCRKGLKPESPNQDSWFILRLEGDTYNCSIYAVFDGHGKKGHDVSQFVKENLPKLMIRDKRFMTDDMKPMLIETFKKMQALIRAADAQKKISAQLSGTTCTVVIHDHIKNKLTTAHVADSTAALSTNRVCTALTRDHKPNLQDERKRIESNGGRVVFDGYANYRVYAKTARYPGLNMSRCLGDLMGHNDCGLSCEPEVNEIQLNDDSEGLLFVCSDGVWEFIEPQEAYDIVAPFSASQSVQAAEKLAKEAWDRWIREEGGSVVDDITVVLVHLNQPKKESSGAA